MYEPRAILKFQVVEGEKKGEFIEMDLTEFTWPKGGTGICPFCGEKTLGKGKEWSCTACGARLHGPIF